MTRTFTHMCISVDGVLALSARDFDRQFKGVFSDDSGRVMSTAEARKVFELARNEGKKVIPCTSKCDNFDYQRGCLGHPAEGDGKDES